jgi:protein-tyrosine-phosphatase
MKTTSILENILAFITVGNVGRSDLAKRFFIARWERERERESQERARERSAGA